MRSLKRGVAALVTASMALLLVVAPGQADGTTGTIQTFPLLAHDSALYVPMGIAAGPDGNMWVTLPNKTAIVKIAPDGTQTEYQNGLSVASVWQITAGPDGKMWFTSFGGKVGSITMDGQVTEYDIAGNPWGIATGPDGNLWVTQTSGGQILKIDPNTGAILNTYQIPGTNPSPRMITPGPDGRMWFTVYEPAGVGAVSMDGTFEMATGVTASSGPTGITSGPDGNVWFTESGINQIGMVTPAGVVTEYAAKVDTPQGIATGPDGNLWFTAEGSNAVVRMFLNGATEIFHVGLTHNSYNIAAAPNGTMWFTQPQDAYSVSTVTTGYDPAAVAPQVRGSGVRDTEIECIAAIWSNLPVDQSVQWHLDGVMIPGENQSIYTVTNADVGKQLTCSQGALLPGMSIGLVAVSSNAITGSATLPGAPQAVVATPEDGSAMVSWVAPGDNGGALISAYTVTASPGGATCTSAGLSCTVPGLTNGSAYTFTVTATNSAGTGPSSSASTAVTPKGAQKITFTSTPPTKPRPGRDTYMVSATGGASGNPVTFAVASDSAAVCRMAGSTVRFRAPGKCVITADQEGNAAYLPAPQATQTITVASLIKQKPLKPLRLPRQLNNVGLTRIVKVPVRTNAGRVAKVRVFGTPLLVSAAGDAVVLRVIRKDGYVWVKLSGTRAMRVRVLISAKPVPGYTGFAHQRDYTTRAVR